MWSKAGKTQKPLHSTLIETQLRVGFDRRPERRSGGRCSGQLRLHNGAGGLGGSQLAPDLAKLPSQLSLACSWGGSAPATRPSTRKAWIREAAAAESSCPRRTRARTSTSLGGFTATVAHERQHALVVRGELLV